MITLRKRMIEEMEFAGLSNGTQDASVKVVLQDARPFPRSDRITERQLYEWEYVPV